MPVHSLQVLPCQRVFVADTVDGTFYTIVTTYVFVEPDLRSYAGYAVVGSRLYRVLSSYNNSLFEYVVDDAVPFSVCA